MLQQSRNICLLLLLLLFFGCPFVFALSRWSLFFISNGVRIGGIITSYFYYIQYTAFLYHANPVASSYLSFLSIIHPHGKRNKLFYSLHHGFQFKVIFIFFHFPFFFLLFNILFYGWKKISRRKNVFVAVDCWQCRHSEFKS